MRVLIEIPDRQLAALAAICTSEKASRSEIIRRAISFYTEQAAPAPAEVFGLWRNSPVDGLVYQERLRSEW